MGFTLPISSCHLGKFWEISLHTAAVERDSGASRCTAFVPANRPFFGDGHLIAKCRGWHVDSSSSSAVRVTAVSLDPTEQKDGLGNAQTSSTFKNSVQTLAVDGRLSPVADFLEKLDEVGNDGGHLTTSAGLLDAQVAIRESLSRGEFDIMLDFVRRLKNAGIQPVDAVGSETRALVARQCRQMVVRGDVEGCVRLLTSLSEAGFNAKRLVDVRFMIKTCAKHRSVNAALRYAALLPPVNLHYNFIMQEFGQMRDVAAVFSAYSSMKKAGIQPDMYSYRSLLDACAHNGDIATATALFEEIVASGAIPNVYVYNSLMNVCAASTEAVWRFYKHMQGLGVEPDLATYNIMLKSCSLSKSFDKAIALYEDVEESDLELDVVTYTTTIDIFGDAKLWESALKVKENMMSSGVTPNVRTWTALIGACANVGMVDQAFRLFNEMWTSGCTPNDQTYNLLIKACCRGSQHERALRLLEEWKESGRICGYRQAEDAQADSNATSSRHARELHLQDGRGDTQLLEKAYYSKPNLITYNTLMKSCGEDIALVEGIMKHILSIGLTPDLKTWSTIIDAHGSRGNVAEAISLFSDMKEKGIMPDLVVYTSVIKVAGCVRACLLMLATARAEQACVRGRDADRAFEYFRQMKDAGIQPNKVTYHTLFRAQRTCRKFSDVQRALALYEEMREAGYAPNDGILRVLLAQWAEGAIEVGQMAQSGSAVLGPLQDEISIEYWKALLQKAAVHAKEPEAEPNLVIDLHGLSRGEARAAVLAMLRIIKERHNQGYQVSDDLVIITGVGKRSEVPGLAVVRQTVLHMLEKELNLPVSFGATTVFIKQKTTLKPSSNWEIVEKTSRAEHHYNSIGQSFSNGKTVSALVNTSESSAVDKMGLEVFQARKPTNFGRLVVSKDALQQWLLRKRSSGTSGKNVGTSNVIADA